MTVRDRDIAVMRGSGGLRGMEAGGTQRRPAVHHEGRTERAGPGSRSELGQSDCWTGVTRTWVGLALPRGDNGCGEFDSRA